MRICILRTDDAHANDRHETVVFDEEKEYDLDGQTSQTIARVIRRNACLEVFRLVRS